MKRHLVILASLFPAALAQEKMTFDDHVFPIFQQACLNCHNPDKTKGGLDLSSFTATLKGSSGGKIVEPGDSGSSLMACVQHTAEPKMPPEGDKLASAQIEILRRWIEDGLLENKNSTARKPSKPKFETALRSNPSAKPDGPPPMPEHLLLEPPVVTSRASAVHALAASPWAPVIAVTGQRQVLLHHTDTLELIGILPFPEGDPISLHFTPDSRYLIVGGGIPGKSGVTVTYDITTGRRLLSVAKEFDSVQAADIRPGFDLVATGGPSRLLKTWDTTTGAQIHSVKKHTDWITALDFSPDGVLLASGDRNGGVWVWESDSCNEFHTLRAHQAAITATLFRADSNLLATASEDGTIRFWEMNGGSEVKKLDAHPGGVTAFTFAPDGSSASAGRDRKLKIWKSDFNLAREITQDLPKLPTAIALNSTSSRVFVADAEGLVRAFQTSDGVALGNFPANPPTIEVRKHKIRKQMVEKEQSLKAAQKIHAEHNATVEAAIQSLRMAEKARDQAIAIQKAAIAGATENPNDGTTRIAADALARLQTTEQAIDPCRECLAAAEKLAKQSAAEVEATQLKLLAHQQNLKHWTAAAVNTRAMAALTAAEESSSIVEGYQNDHRKASQAITDQSVALNNKRREHERLIKRLRSDISSSQRPELEATLVAVEIRLSEEEEARQTLENEFLTLRQSIDQLAPKAHRKMEESISLQISYRKMVK